MVDRDSLLKSKPVEPFTPSPFSVSGLLEKISKTGYQGRRLGEAFVILKKMITDRDTSILMGLAGSMATAGVWRSITWLIDNNYLDVLVSTGANVSEDIYAGLGFPYARTNPCIDDSLLLDLKIDRFYDVLADELLYREMEKLIMQFILDLPEGIYSSAEFLYLLGARLDSLGVPSIVTSAYRKKVPVFVPAIVDSGYGIAALQALRLHGKKLIIDQFKDFDQLVRIVEESIKTGVIYIGGGVPKDTVQLTAVAKSLLKLHKEGVDKPTPHYYAVQITTDSEYWGGLSGATLEEAVSWGKVAEENSADARVDATIAIPLLVSALEELKIQREKKTFGWVFREVEGLVDKVKNK
jgi:deoxyhypusine synthase